jgi:hypothetical protein
MIQYRMPEHEDSTFDLDHADDCWADREVAEAAAEDWHDHHEGWEAGWPVKVEVIRNGKVTATITVDRISVPEFVAQQ